MGARGRNSFAPLAAVVDSAKRPEPPDGLPEEAAAEWRRVVNGLPADWFSAETLAILEHRCRHLIWMQVTAEQIDQLSKAKKFDHKTYDQFMRQAALQARTLLAFDTAMRLTQQSSYDKGKRKGKARSAKSDPWQQAAE
jgi:hypothetical protein